MCVSEFFESADLPCGKYTPDVYARYQDGTRMTLPQDEQHVSYYIHNGKHELDDEWKSDDTHHWKECKNVTDCPSINYSNDQKGDYGQHEYVLDGGTYKCNCGKELSVDLYIWNRATRYLRWNSINIADAYQVSIFDVNGNVEEQLIIDIDDCSDEIKNYFIDNVNGCEFEIELYFDDKQQSSGTCKLAVSVMKDGSIIAESETREYCIHEWGDEWVLFAGNSLHAQKCKYCDQTTNTGSHTYVSGRCICGLERKIDNFVVNSEGEASWSSYSGSYSYLLTITNGNGTTIITQNVTSPNCNIKALLEDNQKPSGTYTITVSALDSSENELTVPASATYNYTSATHYHEGEVDWRWNETHHWKSCELKSECTDKTPDAEHQYNAGRCECGKELTISNLTVDTDGIASWTPFDTAVAYKVTVTDGNGTPVYTETITETNYDVEELLTNNQNPTGTYTVTVSAIKDENEITIETSTDYDYTSPVPVHSHNWSSNWSSNGTYHWKECEASDCDITQDSMKEGYAKHEYVSNKCICGKKKSTTPSVTPQVPPQETPELKPEETPETKPEETPETNPEETPEAKPEETPEVNPEETPESPEGTPEVNPEETPEANPEETPETTPESPEGTPEESPELTPEVNPDNGEMTWEELPDIIEYKVTIDELDGTPIHTEDIDEPKYNPDEILDQKQKPSGTYIVTITPIKQDGENGTPISIEYIYKSPLHTHVWSTRWSNNATHHWHGCVYCDVTEAYAKHQYVNNTCICGKKKNTSNSTTTTPTTPVSAHNHKWATDWTIDDTKHWHKCTDANCTSIQDNAEHKYVEGFCVCGKEVALKLDVNDEGVASWETIVQAGKYIVTVTDVDGNVVCSWDPGTTSVDIEQLLAENGQSAGTYIITVTACDEEAELTKPVSEKYTYKLSENPVDSNNTNEIKEPVATDDLKDINDLNAVDDLNGSNNTKTKKDRNIYRLSILWLIIILIIVAIVVYQKIKSSKK